MTDLEINILIFIAFAGGLAIGILIGSRKK